ncbi:MAG: two-component regulator propeller domain-containing protein, partial [Bacteroidota bacterium]
MPKKVQGQNLEGWQKGILDKERMMSVVQGKSGVMWLGTDEGLLRYDGIEGETVRYDRNSPAGARPPGNEITALHVDREGRIWMGTRHGGLAYLDPETRTIRAICGEYENSRLQGLRVLILQHDDRGQLWVATEAMGLFRVENAASPQPRVRPVALRTWHGKVRASARRLDPTRIESPLGTPILDDDPGIAFTEANQNIIKALYTAEDGTIWLGATRALYKGSLDGDSLLTVLAPDSPFDSLPLAGVHAIAPAGDGLVYLGRAGGIQRASLRNETALRNYRPGAVRIPVENIVPDGDRLWFFQREIGRLGTVSAEEAAQPDAYRTLNDRLENRLILDDAGTLWAWRISGGLALRHPVSLRQGAAGNGEKAVFRLFERRSGEIWVNNQPLESAGDAREVQELDRLDPRIGPGTALVPGPKSELYALVSGGTLLIHGADGRFLREVSLRNFTDPKGAKFRSDGVLWFAERFSLHAYAPTTGRNEVFVRSGGGEINCFEFGPAGDLWLGTRTGLARFSPGGGIRSLNNLALPDPEITALAFGAEGRVLWIGMQNGGLARLDLATETLQNWSRKDGFPDNHVEGMLVDDSGVLWISTDAGLVRFDPKTAQARIFDAADGLADADFADGVQLKAANGKLFFGTRKGLISFFPGEVSPPAVPRAPRIDAVRFGSRTFRLHAPGVTLPEAFREPDRLELPHYQNEIDIRFSAPEFQYRDRVRYSWRLEGHDAEWQGPFERNTAIYGDLPAGTYRFFVRAHLSGAAYSELERPLTITVGRPWYWNPVAMALYAVLLLGGVLILWRIYRNRRQLQVQLRKEKEEASRIRALEAMKSRFFSNLTHEFRTPLSLILGPLEELLQEAEVPEARERLRRLRRSGYRLLDLINQLLDLTRLESGNLPLELRRGDLNAFVEEMYAAFQVEADRKKIDLVFSKAAGLPAFDFDAGKTERICFNLLGNA